MIDKIDNGDGTYHYSGNVFGYKFGKDFANDEEFKTWFKTAIQQKFTGQGFGQMLKELLGITDLEDRVTALENP
jgi:hypothetical protein